MSVNLRVIGVDPAGPVSVEFSDAGFSCTKTLRERFATRGFRDRAYALAESFGQWSVPLQKGDAASGTFVFKYPDAWEPLLIWMERWRREPFFPLEYALKIAADLCTALQTEFEVDVEPEFHAVAVVVSDANAPHCKL